MTINIQPAHITREKTFKAKAELEKKASYNKRLQDIANDVMKCVEVAQNAGLSEAKYNTSGLFDQSMSVEEENEVCTMIKDIVNGFSSFGYSADNDADSSRIFIGWQG